MIVNVMFVRILLLFCMSFFTHFSAQAVHQPSSSDNVDLIIFSYDRPLQLRAYLESLQMYVSGLAAVRVIYRASANSYDSAYQQLKSIFPQVSFQAQALDAYACFKPMVLKAAFEEMHGDYLMFGVDDIIVTDFIDVSQAVEALEKHHAYAFYFRLGKNITQCYTLSVNQDFALPPLTEKSPGIYAWKFKDGHYDWNYPNSVDMTLFRKCDVEQQLRTMNYYTPNNLDVLWDREREKVYALYEHGLCHEYSKMVNIPLNIVQENKRDRNMGFLTPAELLEEFNAAFKIDIKPLFQYKNRAPHAHIIPHFISAKEVSSVTSLSDKQYFCTAADEHFYPWLLSFIGSIHKTNFNNTEEIAVFDLGFSTEQRNQLARIEKVVVYDVEQTHPDIVKKFVTNPQGKIARGWYAWKPVVIKQALEKFPYVLYIDAGSAVLKPLDDIFNYIQEHGHFLLRDQAWFIAGESRLFMIGDHCTNFVRNNVVPADKLSLLNQPGIVAGVQGLSRKVLDSYLLPIYDLTKDLNNFADDGSCPLGFGWARHDQVIFSIYARLLKLDLIEPGKEHVLPVEGRAFKVLCGDFYPDKPHIFYNCKGQVDFSAEVKFKC